jgi:hypothetical protein
MKMLMAATPSRLFCRNLTIIGPLGVAQEERRSRIFAQFERQPRFPIVEKDISARKWSIEPRQTTRHTSCMSRSQNSRRRRLAKSGVAPDDLYDYARPTNRRRGRPIRNDPASWIVKDDWPEVVPVTDAEVDVFEAWFGDLFDELFSTCH